MLLKSLNVLIIHTAQLRVDFLQLVNFLQCSETTCSRYCACVKCSVKEAVVSSDIATTFSFKPLSSSVSTTALACCAPVPLGYLATFNNCETPLLETIIGNRSTCFLVVKSLSNLPSQWTTSGQSA